MKLDIFNQDYTQLILTSGCFFRHIWTVRQAHFLPEILRPGVLHCQEFDPPSPSIEYIGFKLMLNTLKPLSHRAPYQRYQTKGSDIGCNFNF